VEIRKSSVPGAFIIDPQVHSDSRGDFIEWFRSDKLEQASGRPFRLAQSNTSVSRAGVLRGIHFTKNFPGQAKYVTCSQGEVWDYVVDVRHGSPTFGEVDVVVLNASTRRSVFLSEGLGHAFIATKDGSVVNYLVSDVYSPENEFGVNPLDGFLNLELPRGLSVQLSDKDKAAPTLGAAEKSGILPSFTEAAEYYNSIGSGK
jgi:dTDP-4-dehydrorhamnose 3,5-epimerase